MGSDLQQAVPDVTFVVPSYQSRDTLEATLRSILEQDSSLSREVLVVDSTPGPPPPALPVDDPRLVLIHHPIRLWPGAARNLGAARAGGRWLAFVDADAVLEKNWLACLSARLEGDPDAMAGGHVADASPEVDAGSVLHWLEFSEFLPGHRGGRRRFISSSNLFIRRERFLSTGGFDERLRMSEDTAFCRHFPDGVFFCPETGIRHRHRYDWNDVTRHLREHGHWSGIYRRLYPASGSFLARWPALACLLPLWRLPRVVWRVCRSQPAKAGQCLRQTPAVWQGLLAWSEGFQEGLRVEELAS